VALWTIAFDATISVGVQAESEEEAIRGAQEIVGHMEDQGLHLKEGVDCFIGDIFLIRNEETGEEILK
jgi:hypothetical protein